MNLKTVLKQNVAGLPAILHRNRVMGTFTALFLFASLLTVPAIYATTYALTSIFGPSFGSVTLTRATGLAVDAAGNIYIANAENSKIVKIDPNGNLLQTFCASFFECNDPLTVSVDGSVYVGDQNHQRIIKFDAAGNFVQQFTRPGLFPLDIAVDSAGNVYTGDLTNQQVVKFDPAGNVVLSFGSLGAGPGQFDTPRGIALDTAGNIYVADQQNTRVQKFDPAGNFLQIFDINSGVPLDAVRGVAVDSAGNVYVGDTSHGRVVKFDPAGNFLEQIAASGAFDVVVSASGNTVYVADATNKRVLVFTLPPDTIPPELTVPSTIQVAATSAAGAAVTYSATATDNVDGPITPACSPASGSTFPIGTTTVTCTATDAAGNSATATFSIVVLQVFAGVLEPINADGSSIFKLGSTVPIKFRLQDASGNDVTSVPAELRVAQISNGVVGTEMEAVSTSQADTGSTFRIQSNQYAYNLGTSGLSEGTWAIKIYLNYGQPSQQLLDTDNPSDSITVMVSLRN